MSASFYDLLKYAKTGVASPSMTAYDKLKAVALCGGGSTVQTLTGIPPLTFKSDGTPLISWSMLGNGEQTGTPSPQSIIMPTFCGVRTENLVLVSADNDISYSNYTNYTVENGKITNTGRTLVGFAAKVSPQTEYTVSAYSTSGNLRIREYSQKPSSWSANFVVQSVNTLATYGKKQATFTTQAETTWVLVCWYSEVENAVMYNIMLNLGSTALPYEPYGWKIQITCAGQTVPVYLGQTQTVRRIKKLVLTGEESTWANVGGNAPYRIMLPGIVSTSDKNSVLFLSSHYLAVPNSASWAQYSACVSWAFSNLNTNVKCVQFRDTNQATLSDFKSYIAQQYSAGTPVCVWYVLAEPTTGIVNEPLAKIGDYADELHSTDAGVSIPTAKGSNTLTVETDLQPSEVSITGKIKPA